MTASLKFRLIKSPFPTGPTLTLVKIKAEKQQKSEKLNLAVFMPTLIPHSNALCSALDARKVPVARGADMLGIRGVKAWLDLHVAPDGPPNS
jgi:hypothetical protein